MVTGFEGKINIKKIIDTECIKMQYLPVVSVRNQAVLGLEALCRGIYGTHTLSPEILFHTAREEGLIVELDRLCRKKAMEDFSQFISSNPNYRDLILFINFHASVIDQGVLGSGQLLNTTHMFGLRPSQIAIEIVESDVHDTESLKQFIETHRNHGFIIALDDVGASYSNLSRLAIAKPDILKIDISIVRNIDKEFYKQEVLKSLVSLSKKIGALVIAEGIENVDEAIMSLDIGADMLQGFYFLEPDDIGHILTNHLEEKNSHIASMLKDYVLEHLHRENCHRQEYNLIVNKIIWELAVTKEEDFDSKLHELIGIHRSIECIYVLDISGIQVTDTVCQKDKISKQKKTLFQPSPKGTDHSMKKYYYLSTSSVSGMYITDPYISLASGNICTTISTVFMDTDSHRYILCIDASSF